MYTPENGFSALLDALEAYYDDGNRIGRPLRKSHSPAQTKPVRPARVTKITRSRHPMRMRYEGGDRSDFNKTIRELELLNKSIQLKSRAATIRLRKPRRTDLRKALIDFDRNFKKSIVAGELSPDQICLIEARMNRMLQRPMTGVI